MVQIKFNNLQIIDIKQLLVTINWKICIVGKQYLCIYLYLLIAKCLLAFEQQLSLNYLTILPKFKSPKTVFYIKYSLYLY